MTDLEFEKKIIMLKNWMYDELAKQRISFENKLASLEQEYNKNMATNLITNRQQVLDEVRQKINEILI